MKRTGFSVLLFWSLVVPRAAGNPLPTDSPGRAYAAVGADVILPCGRGSPAGVTAVEWSRVTGSSQVTACVVRDGKELVKEKAAEYAGRTAILENGSLTLGDVQQQDSSTYLCVRVTGGSVDKVLVSLRVVQVPEVDLSVRWSADNQLLVQCESSGWTLEPRVLLMNSSRSVLDAQTNSSVGLDHLYAVRALVAVATAGVTLTGSGAVICRVEIPGTSLSNENKVYITDEVRLPAKEGLGSGLAWVLIVVFVVLAVVVFVCLVMMNRRLRLSVTDRLTVARYRAVGRGNPDGFSEYGDIRKVETTGASEAIARANEVAGRGVEASHQMAEQDLMDMRKYRSDIISVGLKLHVHPALIAAIISRQSRAGRALSPEGYGMYDNNCFGLMQIHQKYHAKKGGPYSREHLDQGVTFLIQPIMTMKREHPDWTDEQRLKGALACYIAGEDRVINLDYKDLDTATPYGDFTNDVVARAQWFADNGF